MTGQLTDPNLETELCRDVFCCVRMANSTVGNSKAMKEEDCLGCRLVSGFGLFFIGAYLYRQSQRQSGTFSKITVVSLSAVSIGLGVARICNAPLFTKDK